MLASCRFVVTAVPKRVRSASRKDPRERDSTSHPRTPRIARPGDRPVTIALPTVGDGLTWRPVAAADIGLLLDLKRAAEKTGHPRSPVTRNELEEEFKSAAFDPEHDAVIAIDADLAA
ncbi:hypothetical protein [Streptosporangium sandarakinum]